MDERGGYRGWGGGGGGGVLCPSRFSLASAGPRFSARAGRVHICSGEGEETALEKALAALTIHNKKKWHDSKSRAGSWSRGGSRGNRRGGQSCQPLCKRHEMYGDGTWHWDYPKHAPGLKTSRPG